MDITIEEISEIYQSDERRHRDGRPWVMMNMITSIDGAVAIAGSSRSLGGPADAAVFSALRSACDVIIVAAGTVRSENYGPPALPRELSERRMAAGRETQPRLAVVTKSMQLDPNARLFSGTDSQRPMIVTVDNADPERVATLSTVAEIVTAGVDDVTPAEAIAAVTAGPGQVVLCEGGPSLNGQFFAADAFDELCVTISPMIVGGDAQHLAGAGGHDMRHYELDRLLRCDGMIFSRYLRKA